MKTLSVRPSAGLDGREGCRKLTAAVGRKRQGTVLPRAEMRGLAKRRCFTLGRTAARVSPTACAGVVGGHASVSRRWPGVLFRLLRGPGEEAVGPDDVTVVVGRVEAGDGVVGRASLRLAVAAVAEDRDDADAAQRGGVVAVVGVLVLPAVQDRDLLNVLGHQDGGEVGLSRRREVGQVDVTGGGGSGGGGARLVGQPGEHGGANALGVSQGTLLLRLLQSVKE